ncbi:MAG: hypothetical protein AAFV95_05800 [Bacteroidota bacterium]
MKKNQKPSLNSLKKLAIDEAKNAKIKGGGGSIIADEIDGL